MMNEMAKTLGAVHTHTHTHTHTQLFYKIKTEQREKNNIGNKAGILQYALLNIHARDG